MANTLKIKRSSTPAAVPTTGQLEPGELAMNTADGYLFMEVDGPSIKNLTDHGGLAGLSDDDHSIYALLAGRSGGQTLKGGTAAANDLTFVATSGAGVGGESIIFRTGNNGATTAATIETAGLTVGTGRLAVGAAINSTARVYASETLTTDATNYSLFGAQTVAPPSGTNTIKAFGVVGDVDDGGAAFGSSGGILRGGWFRGWHNSGGGFNWNQVYGSMSEARVGNGSDDTVTSAYGSYNYARANSSSTGTVATEIYGSYNRVDQLGTGTFSSATGAYCHIGALPSGAATISAANGVWGVIEPSHANATITTATAGKFTILKTAGTITTAIGLRVDDVTSQGSTVWSAQFAGGNSYHVGRMTFGAAAAPATSALLDLSSTTGALLLPRMTTTERDALTAANGMAIYNTTTTAVEFRQNGAWSSGAGVTDHGALTGLSDDDHSIYALLAGRSGGQVLTAGTGASDALTLRSTTSATKGLVAINDQGGNVTLGGGTTASELRFLEPSGSGTNYTGFIAPALAGNVIYTLPTADAASSGQVLSSNASAALSWVTRTGRYSETFTATTTRTVTHSLGTQYVCVAVYDSAGVHIETGWTATSTTVVTLNFVGTLTNAVVVVVG